jgi:hypothetical protein
MDVSNFIAVGENIHCTRIVKSAKSGGKRTKELPGGGEALVFSKDGSERLLKVPANWAEFSPPYNDGKVRHVALAIYQMINGTSEERKDGEDYICWVADRQIEKGAKFLDVNVDEYTTDNKERMEVMDMVGSFLSQRYETPLSIDSSNVETLRTGLDKCRKDKVPMVNSVSLERIDAVDTIIDFEAEAIVSAAGAKDLPSGIDDRMTNFREIIKILNDKGMPIEKMHLDALVFPVSVDAKNGANFIEASAKAKEEYPGINLSGGLSNISYGLPKRKLINMVFTYMFVEKGGNGGIIDPVQMPPGEVASLDEEDEAFKLAKGVLDGSDMFGMEYIAASRDGRI